MKIEDLYHTGMVVQDIHAALGYYKRVHHIEFTKPQHRCLDVRDGERKESTST